MHEVRSDAKQDGAFGKCFVYQMDVAEFQVADATMNQAARAAAGAPPDGVLLQQRDRETAQRGVPGDASADDSATQDEQVLHHQ